MPSRISIPVFPCRLSRVTHVPGIGLFIYSMYVYRALSGNLFKSKIAFIQRYNSLIGINARYRTHGQPLLHLFYSDPCLYMCHNSIYAVSNRYFVSPILVSSVLCLIWTSSHLSGVSSVPCLVCPLSHLSFFSAARLSNIICILPDLSLASSVLF